MIELRPEERTGAEERLAEVVGSERGEALVERRELATQPHELLQELGASQRT